MKKAEAISILATSVRPREAKDRAKYDKAVKMAIEALNSSEFPNNSDTISRQAAIDALADMHCKSDEDGYVWIIRSDAWARIDALPPVTPKQRWTPCSERLPEESGRYLVSVLDGVGRRTTVAPYQPRYKAWTMTGRMAYWKVTAWMPLPESYRGANE